MKFPFPREHRISFNEEKHEYTIDGLKAPRSVTGLLHEYASEFEPQRALLAMKGGRDWHIKRAALEEQGLGTDDRAILDRWRDNGEIARARGHLLHHQCEQMVIPGAASLDNSASSIDHVSTEWIMAPVSPVFATCSCHARPEANGRPVEEPHSPLNGIHAGIHKGAHEGTVDNPTRPSRNSCGES